MHANCKILIRNSLSLWEMFSHRNDYCYIFRLVTFFLAAIALFFSREHLCLWSTIASLETQRCYRTNSHVCKCDFRFFGIFHRFLCFNYEGWNGITRTNVSIVRTGKDCLRWCWCSHRQNTKWFFFHVYIRNVFRCNISSIAIHVRKTLYTKKSLQQHKM